MTTTEIITEINAMTIVDSDDFDPLERLDILADELAKALASEFLAHQTGG